MSAWKGSCHLLDLSCTTELVALAGAKISAIRRSRSDAGDVTAAKTEADCKKASGMWDAATNTCLEKKM
jgi:hypothetical protein